MVSSIRHLQLHYPLLETKRNGLIIVNFPDSFRLIPFAASLFDAALHLSFVEFNPQSDSHRLLKWRTAGFFDDLCCC
jgi:hypothetical protein